MGQNTSYTAQLQDLPEVSDNPRENGDVAFESPASIPVSGKATSEAVANATKTPASEKTMFAPASRKAAIAAKKGTTSISRTGKAKQASYEFARPPKKIYVKLHPSPGYHTFALPVYENEDESTFHYIDPELYDSGTLPQRFQRACKLMDVHTTGCADGTFFLWRVFVSASKWRKGALKAIEAARKEYVIINSIRARQTYSIEPADTLIAEPKRKLLPTFEQLLMDAFDSRITVSDDQVVGDFMRGGAAADDEDEDE